VAGVVAAVAVEQEEEFVDLPLVDEEEFLYLVY
jgi:hypothetical protein